MLCNQVHPNMALNWDRSSTTKNCTLRVIGLTWTGNTMSPKDVVEAPFYPDSIRPGFSRLDGTNPICLITDSYKRSVELPGSIRIRLTSKSMTPSVMIRASWCSCSIWLGSIGGKVITPSIGCALPLVSLGRTGLTCSRTEAARSNICLFHLELYSLFMGPPWI